MIAIHARKQKHLKNTQPFDISVLTPALQSPRCTFWGEAEKFSRTFGARLKMNFFKKNAL